MQKEAKGNEEYCKCNKWNQKMRIGIVAPFNPWFIKDYLFSDDIPNINNAATAVNTLGLSLLQSGHHLKIFTVWDEADAIKKLLGNDVEIYLIPYRIWNSRPKCLQLKRFNTFGLAQLYMPKRLRKVIEPEIESLDILHAHWTYEYAMAAHYFSNMKPVYVTVRDWAPYIRSLQEKLFDRMVWWQKYKTFRKVMKDKQITFIANSQYTYDRIISDFPHNTVYIIPNPIKKEKIIREKRYKGIRHRFVSISQNIGDPRKNYTPMLEAFRMYKIAFLEAELHLIGFYDAHSDYYHKWESKNLLEGVVFHGSMPYDQMMSLMDEMSCLIHPSLEETFGNILLEAMARCVPCIGGEKSGAVPQVLGNGKYGLLCDVCDPNAIYESMCRLSDLEYAESLSQKATDMLSRTYSSDIIALKHIALFQNGLNEKRKGF